MSSEERFWNTLKEIFIGGKIEGDSGFVNLMRIKSAYFDSVFSELQRIVEEGTASFPDFREELFDKLYSFFKRYFSESGSIYFTYTPLKENVYEKVYTNLDDVVLFWKTHMLYYVKTDRLWHALTVKVKGLDGTEYDLEFDVKNMTHRYANERRELVFELDRYVGDTKKVVLSVSYSTHGRKTSVDDIAKALNRKNLALDLESVQMAIDTFYRQNEVDFFINKDAEGFLKEQFDIYLKTYALDEESIFDEARLNQLKFIRHVAHELIEFVAKFENELERVWNKPKFVRGSDYVLTLDRLLSFEGGFAFLKKITRHKGFSDQVQEWKTYHLVDNSFVTDSLFVPTVDGEERISQELKFLCIDTKHFGQDVKLELQGLIRNHDEELDGWVIHSENYQALRTMNPRFKGSVGIIYIDPPYNTGIDGFPYKDRFMHSSWLTMMENRLITAKDFLKPDGMIFVSIDDCEQPHLRLLMDDIFRPENRLAVISWEKRFTRSNNAKLFYPVKDYLLAYQKSGAVKLLREPRTERADALYSNPDNDPRGPWMGASYVNPVTREQRPNLVYPIINPYTGEEITHSTHAWKHSLEEHQRHVRDKLLYWGEKGDYTYPRLKVFLREVGDLVPIDIWDYETTGTTDEGSIEMKNLFGGKVFDNPKPTRLVQRIGSLKVNGESISGSIFFDFFAGSGTTAHAVMRMNQQSKKPKNRFLLIEMADYVHTIIIPRLKRCAFAAEWKDGKPRGGEGCSLFFKYYHLEQYEEVLKRAVYRRSHMLEHDTMNRIDLLHSYLFIDDRKFLDAVDFDGESPRVDIKRIYADIDLAESLANLKGKMIRRIGPDGVRFSDDEYISFSSLCFSDIREMIWW